MANRDKHRSGQSGEQKANSRQSGQQGGQEQPAGKPAGSGQQSQAGIGSSQGQDRGSPREQRERTDRSSGTSDIERPTPSNASDSIVNDMTGAFKERP